MTESLLTTLTQQLGAVGTVIIAAAYALRMLLNRLTESQEKRVADAQAATTKLLDLVEAQHKHQAMLSAAIDGNANAIQSLRELIATLADRASAGIDQDARDTAARMMREHYAATRPPRR